MKAEGAAIEVGVDDVELEIWRIGECRPVAAAKSRDFASYLAAARRLPSAALAASS